MDRFLGEHLLAANTYRLCGPWLSPVSVRDMVLRAEELIDRLIVGKEINDKSRVLVIGAGITGIACTLKLLNACGCHVTLSSDSEPLSTQAGVRHREIARMLLIGPIDFIVKRVIRSLASRFWSGSEGRQAKSPNASRTN